MSDTEVDTVELINSRRAGFSKLLGLVVTEATPDCVKATLEVREELCTRPEVLHGGAIMAFADNLGALACVLNLPEGAWTTTLESKTNFLSSIPVGQTAYAETTALHKGRSTMVWRTDIKREDGKLCAVVTQTQMVLMPSKLALANSVFKRSVISMCPGLWVMQIGGLACSTMICGVTPQAQKTGTSFWWMTGGDPEYGFDMSSMPPSRDCRNEAACRAREGILR